MAPLPYRQSRDPFVWIVGILVFSVLIGSGLAIEVVQLLGSRSRLTAQYGGVQVHLASIRFGEAFGKETVCGTYTVTGDRRTWRFLTWADGAWAEGRFPYAQLPDGTATAYRECLKHDRTGGNSRGGLVVLYDPPARFLANL